MNIKLTSKLLLYSLTKVNLLKNMIQKGPQKLNKLEMLQNNKIINKNDKDYGSYKIMSR